MRHALRGICPTHYCYCPSVTPVRLVAKIIRGVTALDDAIDYRRYVTVHKVIKIECANSFYGLKAVFATP
ncbi:hypothetical protein GCM10008111_10970 [Alishewanella tabrizica]|uniref:Uncharacterized protein n=1 Tax=Alishewanella tabrizica TaxID=671278 RepID=A0ABQ2WKN4_9ALTE|nr:hypothetical protein GCM10008111_10970 [Alishewanella tabrizica]